MKTKHKKDLYRELRNNGWTLQKIADKFGVTRQAVHYGLGYINPSDLIKQKNKKIEYEKKKIIFKNNLYKITGKKITFGNITKITKIRSGTRDRIRELVRIRDNHTCQMCGRVWKEGERRFDIHHIDCDNSKTRKVDKIKDFNNLITLCHKCHLNIDEHKNSMRIKKLSTVI